jgi:hypothetical protein
VKTRPIPIQPEKRPHCYICGATENLTDDHLPPQGFFHPTDAKGLITAPLCNKCHRPLAKDDEIMRMWMSADIKASARGKWIFQNKVLRSTIPRSQKLLENIQPYLKQIKTGSSSGAIFNIPQSRAIPFIRRLTKGLLYTLHPDYDYFPDYFSVGYELPTQKSFATLKKLTSALSQLQRGEDTFKVWHGITTDTRDSGAWVYLFYGAVCFVCMHSKRQTFQQNFPEGYVEHPSLPKFL